MAESTQYIPNNPLNIRLTIEGEHEDTIINMPATVSREEMPPTDLRWLLGRLRAEVTHG